MQHIVQIAFDFDDARITKHIESSVEQQVIQKITDDIEKQMFQSSSWTGREIDPTRDNLRLWVKTLIKEEFATYKDEIIAKAVKDIVDSTKRSKAFKEKLDNSLN